MNDNTFKMTPCQADALAELRKSLDTTPDMAAQLVAHRSNFRTAYEGVWQGGDDTAAYWMRSISLPNMIRDECYVDPLPAGQYRIGISQCVPLPHVSREESPHCRSVRVWDAKGYSPAVELHKRHPLLLVADDWRRATTFDLYAMAMKTQASWIADMTIDDIVGVKKWVEFMDDVQHLIFDDVTAPAQLYANAVFRNNVKSLFKGGIGLDYVRLTLIRLLYPIIEAVTGRTKCGK